MRKSVIVKEADKRLERCEQQKQHDGELHALKLKEMEMKVMAAEEELKRNILEREQMTERHQFEIEILKKKLRE